jgi:hypothetical protein
MKYSIGDAKLEAGKLHHALTPTMTIRDMLSCGATRSYRASTNSACNAIE